MKNEQPQWLTDILADQRHLQELRWSLEDIQNESDEERAYKSEQNRLQIIEEKDKISYNYRGQRIIYRQPFKY